MVTVDALVSTLALTVPLGVLGAVAMDLPMATLEEGLTPAYAAAATLRGTAPESVGAGEAWAVHHLAGVAAGVLYGLVVAVLGPLVGGPVASGAVATAFVTAFLYGFFVWLVLPRQGFARQRLSAIRRQWTVSAVVFGVVVLVGYSLVG